MSDENDPLLGALRSLPTHEPSDKRVREQTARVARAAFVHAFDDTPWYGRVFGNAGKAAVPVVLASVVGLYLFWAFAVAISLNQ